MGNAGRHYTFFSYIQPEKVSTDLWTRNTTLRSAPGSNHVKQAWSNNTTTTPTAVAGRIPGASVQGASSGKSIFGGKEGVPSSKTVPFEMEKKLENPTKEKEDHNKLIQDEQVIPNEINELHQMNSFKMSVNGGSKGMVVQEAA